MDEVPNGASIAFDSMVIIYYMEEHPDFLDVVEPLFDMIAVGRAQGYVSTISLVEVLVGPLRSGEDALVQRYRELLANAPNFTLISLTPSVAERAAHLRATHNLQTPDAVVAACVIEEGCTHLVTNDPIFRRVPGLGVLVVSDFVSP